VVVTESSFETCFREHFAGLVALGESMTGDRGVAHDLAQETFARLHDRWDTVGDCRPDDDPTAFDPDAWSRLVAVLPARQRLTVTLFYGYDQPITEVAETLGVSVNTVKSSLAKARIALRAEMERCHVE